MTTPHPDAGDEDIRAYIESNWTHIALIDDDAEEVTRIDIEEDSRASFTSGAETNPLTIEVTVEGSDDDIPVPTTFTRSELYKVDTGGDELSGDDFDEGSAEIASENDTLQVTHDVEQPVIE